MAVQMHFAYSKYIISSSIVAGGPYYYSMGSYEGWEHNKKYPQKVNLDKIYEYINNQDISGNLDPISNLQNSRVFIFHGIIDSIIYQATGRLGYDVFKNYIPRDNIYTYFNITAEHNWPTDNFGGRCSEVGIKNCNFDAAGKILALAFGELKPRVYMIASNLKRFKQADYVSSLSEAGMAETGFIYIPTNCTEDENNCRVHVFLHGCMGNFDYAGTYYVEHTGLNQWAEANDIIIIYPQTAKNGPSEIDEKGCWDVWGYTGENFATKNGIQMKAIYDMAQNPPVKYEHDCYSHIYT